VREGKEELTIVLAAVVVVVVVVAAAAVLVVIVIVVHSLGYPLTVHQIRPPLGTPSYPIGIRYSGRLITKDYP